MMGLSDLTKAAQKARDAENEYQRKMRWNNNAQAAKRIVASLLGVLENDVEVLKALNTDQTTSNGRDYTGKYSTVRVNLDGDDVFLLVETDYSREYVAKWYLNLLSPAKDHPRLTISEDRGAQRPYPRWNAESLKIRSMADLGDALDTYRKTYSSLSERFKIVEPLYYVEEQ